MTNNKKELGSLTKMREVSLLRSLSLVNALNDCYARCIHELICLSGLILYWHCTNQMALLIRLLANNTTQSRFSVS